MGHKTTSVIEDFNKVTLTLESTNKQVGLAPMDTAEVPVSALDANIRTSLRIYGYNGDSVKIKSDHFRIVVYTGNRILRFQIKPTF